MVDRETAPSITVEIICARKDRQAVVQIQVPVGTTAREAVQRAQLDTRFPELDLMTSPLASYGQLLPDHRLLKDGDRVEVLRDLQRDPRDARRELAARGETMVGRPAGDE
jgi:putative ubiquitin-RnfH superfamily antitoxin RatB of RatAB toxin-antitoxin module